MANRLPMMIVTRLIGVPDVDIDQLDAVGILQHQGGRRSCRRRSNLRLRRRCDLELASYIVEHFDQAAAEPRGRSDQRRCIGPRLRRIGGIDSAADDHHVVQCGRRIHRIVDRLGRVHPRDAGQTFNAKCARNPDLLGAFLEEVLRYEPPFRGHYRHVLTDTTLAGVDLKAGSRLFLLWGAANRDPSHFDNANEFRLDRPDSKGHISFGKGAHFCVGAALARLEARIVIGKLARAHHAGSRPPIPAVGCRACSARRLERLELSVA